VLLVLGRVFALGSLADSRNPQPRAARSRCSARAHCPNRSLGLCA